MLKNKLSIVDNISLKSPAKINLALDIVGIRSDGYHFINSVIQPINLFDIININTNNSEDIQIFCNHLDAPTDISNTAYKSSLEFFNYTGIKNIGIEVYIEKNIPIQAGLAGGSADGAGVLVGLNRMFNTGLSISELCHIGLKVGCDVPFCIVGKPALVEGVGENIREISSIPKSYILLVKPNFGISTKEAYKSIDRSSKYSLLDINEFLKFIFDQKLELISKKMYNIFESVLEGNNLEIFNMIKRNMIKYGSLGCLMSGSGSSIFGIFDNLEKAIFCRNFFIQQFSFAEIFEPYNGGIIIN